MDLLHLFEHAAVVEEYSAGDTIFEEGSPGDVLYVVLDGQVDISIRGKTIDTAGPGDIVGEMALIDAESRSATATALTDCRVTPVSERKFLFMIQQTPFFSLNVMRVLADRLRRMDTEI
jgi:CRP/FNR family cyclic AMP-dependent transcriptional regulator